MDIASQLSEQIKITGFSHFGLSPLERPLTFHIYEEWIRKGLHGDMNYLKEHLPLKESPRQLGQTLSSAIVIAQPYYPHPKPQDHAARVALYAQGEDYHFWFQQKLEELRARLLTLFPNHEFLCFTDSKPILERDLAHRAAIGWVGKNSCLIHPQHGSLFFLGEILTSLQISTAAKPVPDHCGTCDRCVKACPTQALLGDRTMDASKCISYLTIESKNEPPLELRKSIGDWFFGCDICQTVCPWNGKVFGRQAMQDLAAAVNSSSLLLEELRFILNSSNRTLTKTFQSSPLLRARPFGLKRNALIVIANQKLVELKEEVHQTSERYPRLKELALWTLSELEKLPSPADSSILRE